MSYQFSYGPAASNLYFSINDNKYTMTFDYSFDSLYFRKDSTNLLNLNLLESKWDINLDNNDKMIFKNMLNRTYQETKGFKFNNISNLIPKLDIIRNTIL